MAAASAFEHSATANLFGKDVFTGRQDLFPAINMGEPAVLYCFIFLYLAAAGPGPWAIDRG